MKNYMIFATCFFASAIFACDPVTIVCASVPQEYNLLTPSIKITCDGAAVGELSSQLVPVTKTVSNYELVPVTKEGGLALEAIPVQKTVTELLGFDKLTTDDVVYQQTS